MNTVVIEDDDRHEREYDDDYDYEDLEYKHGRGGVEKFNKSDTKGKYVPGKKKVKHRQLTEVDIY